MHINDAAIKRAWTIWKLSQTEEQYAQMLKEIRELEREYEAALDLLPKQQEDTVRDYVSQCEAMSWRMLQIACAMMRFADSHHE